MSFDFSLNMLEPKARTGVGHTSPSFSFEPDVIPKQEFTLAHRPGVTNMSSMLDRTEASLNALADSKAAESSTGFWNQKYENPINQMTNAQALGMGVASEGLKIAGAMHDIRANEEAQMAQMRDEFDLAFGSQEFDAQRLMLKQEHDQIDQMLAALDNIDRQAAAYPAQTLRSQQQTFIRNPL